MLFTRTKIYSVYLKKDSVDPLDTAVFVCQSFNFWAFLLTIFWALFNRLWLVSAIIFALNIFLMKFEGPVVIATTLLMNIWFGFEANYFKAAKLERKGYILFDVATGIDITAARQRFFDKYAYRSNRQFSQGTSPQAA